MAMKTNDWDELPGTNGIKAVTNNPVGVLFGDGEYLCN